ncbi:transglycosylase family protein [Streptomyces virginiae]|uniref:transglycosylase family protein n=1 Tax=Streptomyces virginiae TaxID=1961 RepID=UPI0036B0B121
MRYPLAFFRLRHRVLAAALTSGTIVPAALGIGSSAASAAEAATWDRVASCESSGNWSIDTGNGLYGGLQFAPGTWADFGGHQYASNAHLATKEQQIEIAEKVLATQGPGAWPVCSVKAGLTADSSSPPLDTGRNNTQELSTTGSGQLSAQSQSAEIAPQDPAGQTPGTDESTPAAAGSGSAPVDASVTTGYRVPGSWAAGYHTGVDFAVPTGTGVKAVTSGTVVSAGWAGAYGNAVVLHHDDGLYSLYAHLSSTSVAPGQKTASGQTIGLSGSTGNSTGPHLHLEIRTENNYDGHTDPVTYLRSIGVPI